MGRLMKMYAQKFSSEKDIDVISFGISCLIVSIQESLTRELQKT